MTEFTPATTRLAVDAVNGSSTAGHATAGQRHAGRTPGRRSSSRAGTPGRAAWSWLGVAWRSSRGVVLFRTLYPRRRFTLLKFAVLLPTGELALTANPVLTRRVSFDVRWHVQ